MPQNHQDGEMSLKWVTHQAHCAAIISVALSTALTIIALADKEITLGYGGFRVEINREHMNYVRELPAPKPY